MSSVSLLYLLQSGLGVSWGGIADIFCCLMYYPRLSSRRRVERWPTVKGTCYKTVKTRVPSPTPKYQVHHPKYPKLQLQGIQRPLLASMCTGMCLLPPPGHHMCTLRQTHTDKINLFFFLSFKPGTMVPT